MSHHAGFLAAPKVDVDAQADVADIRNLLPEGGGDTKTHTTTFSKSITLTSDGNRTVKKTVIERDGEREEFTETTGGDGNDQGKAEARAGANAGNGAAQAKVDGDFKGAGLEALLDNPDIPESMRNMIRAMLEQLRDQDDPGGDDHKRVEGGADAQENP